MSLTTESGQVLTTEDGLALDIEGEETSEWGEQVEFTGITQTQYQDDTVVAGNWYRYQVADAESGEPTGEFTEWVQIQVEAEPPPLPVGFEVGWGPIPI